MIICFIIKRHFSKITPCMGQVHRIWSSSTPNGLHRVWASSTPSMGSSTASMGFKYTRYGLQVHWVWASSTPSIGHKYIFFQKKKPYRVWDLNKRVLASSEQSRDYKFTRHGLQVYHVRAASTTSMVTITPGVCNKFIG